MADITTAKGYGISDTKNFTKFSVQEFPLKKVGPREVTIEIMFCGVCGSDVHTITGGWGPLSTDWVCPGHEIVGKVLHAGDEAAKEFPVGSIAGVGAQVWSCMDCSRCKGNNENYCPHQVDTYNAPFPDICEKDKGLVTQGGYSTHIRADKQFVFPIPEGLKPEDAAPMLCAGITVYSPLIRNGTGPGKLVGIIGMGGLGHFAVQFAKALGAKVIVFGHSPSKAPDAIRLGADQYISTADSGFGDKFGAGKGPEFDFILSCADANKIPLGDFLSMLKVHGKLNTVGIPDEPFSLATFDLVPSGASFAASHLGSRPEVIEMLDLAVKHNIKPIIPEILPMSKAATAIQAVHDNTVRYRYVLKQDLL